MLACSQASSFAITLSSMVAGISDASRSIFAVSPQQLLSEEGDGAMV